MVGEVGVGGFDASIEGDVGVMVTRDSAWVAIAESKVEV